MYSSVIFLADFSTYPHLALLLDSNNNISKTAVVSLQGKNF